MDKHLKMGPPISWQDAFFLLGVNPFWKIRNFESKKPCKWGFSKRDCRWIKSRSGSFHWGVRKPTIGNQAGFWPLLLSCSEGYGYRSWWSLHRCAPITLESYEYHNWPAADDWQRYAETYGLKPALEFYFQHSNLSRFLDITPFFMLSSSKTVKYGPFFVK